MFNLRFFNGEVLPMGKYDFDGVCIELSAEKIKMRVQVEEEPAKESDPNQTVIDGTVHPEDEEEGDGPTGDLSPLAQSLQDIKDRVDANLADDGDAA